MYKKTCSVVALNFYLVSSVEALDPMVKFLLTVLSYFREFCQMINQRQSGGDWTESFLPAQSISSKVDWAESFLSTKLIALAALIDKQTEQNLSSWHSHLIVSSYWIMNRTESFLSTQLITSAAPLFEKCSELNLSWQAWCLYVYCCLFYVYGSRLNKYFLSNQCHKILGPFVIEYLYTTF